MYKALSTPTSLYTTVALQCEKMQGWGFVYLPSLLYPPLFVVVFFFSFLMIFLLLCVYFFGDVFNLSDVNTIYQVQPPVFTVK